MTIVVMQMEPHPAFPPVWTVALLALLSAGALLEGQTAAEPRRGANTGGPAWFEENRGQTSPAVRYVGRTTGLNVLFERSLVRMRLGGAHELRLRLPSPGVRPRAEEPEGFTRYYLGSRRIQARHFRRIRYPQAAPGIDLVFYATDGRLEYDVELAPGARIDRFVLKVEGSGPVTPSLQGGLDFLTPAGLLRQHAPVAWQQTEKGRSAVPVRQVSDGRTIRFLPGPHDPKRLLTIDPVVEFSTFLGGISLDASRAIAVDDSGVYVAGFTQSLDFPSAGGVPANPVLPIDVFVAKFDLTGTRLLFSTILGGEAGDEAFAMAIAPGGDLLVAGRSESTGFPASTSAFQRLPADVSSGNGDAFVARLGSTDGRLIAATFLGGAGRDAALSIATQADGSVFAGGETAANNFPARRSFRNEPCADAGFDGWLARLSPDLSRLDWAAYVCGDGPDRVTGVAAIPGGGLVAVGDTQSVNFPTSSNRFRTLTEGDRDAFFLRLPSDGAALTFATFLGGRESDVARGVSVNAAGNAYVVGDTFSPDFPGVAAGAVSALSADAFVALIDPQNRLAASRRFGGSAADSAFAVAATADRVYVAGQTASPAFPVTSSVCQTGFGGGIDAFLSVFHANLSTLASGLFLGGSADDSARAVSVRGGIAYVAGETGSSNFPTTAGAFRPAYAAGFRGIRDSFVAAISESAQPVPPCIALNGVVNGATFRPGPLAPGEIVSIFGAGLGPPQLAGLNLASGFVTTEIAGTRILFDGQPAPMLFAVQNQASAIVPFAVAGRQETTVVVEVGGRRSTPLRIPVTQASPGIFSLNASGRGPGAILNQNGSVNTSDNPADRGSIVVIFATGAGVTAPASRDGQIVPALQPFPLPVAPVSARIGGVEAEVLYAGAAPLLVAGVLQVNIRVPLSLNPGIGVPIRIVVGGVNSQEELFLAIR